jgi:hypothetical protein
MAPVEPNPGARAPLDFEARLARLDVHLFDAIPSQLSDHDRRSLLACQLAVRRLQQPYVYLEIGSHLGGSLQTHLQDRACARLFSLDSRPASQADARGPRFHYEGNSTARMRALLEALVPGRGADLVCFEATSTQLDPQAIDVAPQLCFIDGEHTDEAAWADFQLCRRVLAPSGGLIVFHDAAVVYEALARVVGTLQAEGVAFHAYNLPDVLFCIELGRAPVHRQPEIAALLLDNHVGYLASLRLNAPYRRFANRRLFRWLRALRAWLPARRRAP